MITIVVMTCSIPFGMIVASFFLNQDTMEWNNPFSNKESK